MLYRIAATADWQRAQRTGFFTGPDLTAEGFLHTSERHQVLATAARHYAGCTELVLLEINEDALAAGGVRVVREWVPSRHEHFAHVYGPIPLAAVVRAWPFATDAAGTFQLPPDL